MDKEVNIKKLVGNLAKRSRIYGLSKPAFRSKAKTALVKAGISEPEAKRISTGISINSKKKITEKKAIKVIKALRKEGLLKTQMKDIKGEVVKFVAKDKGSGEDEKQKKIREAEVRRRLRKRDDENGKQTVVADSKAKAKVKSTKTNVTPSTVFKTPPTKHQPIQAPLRAPEASIRSKVELPTEDEEIKGLRRRAEEQDLPLD